ncbi:MAG: methyltransferase [Pseudomonadota bacterium]
MSAAVDSPETTEDRFLGGRVTLVQPVRPAHRAGSDAVFLAATVGGASGRALDMGAGCGAVGLIAALRSPDLSVDLVDNDPLQLSCARQSMEKNARLAPRMRLLAADLLATERERTAAGLVRESYDLILSNPPYRQRARVQTDAARLAAHTFSHEELDAWLRCAASLLKPYGTLTMIFAADGLKLLLQLFEGRFGDARVLGLHPSENSAAERILIQATKGRRAPPKLLPGLILHHADGSYTDRAKAILSGRASIEL